MTSSDLQVNSISESLLGKSIDVVITGSIGSVEAVRFLRSLRRLGADVHPWLSKGAKLFTTETAVSWAAARPVTTNFSGTASHIALHDACIVSPASANFISKISNGITDTPESALVASYLGQGKPVLVMPNMHDSLIQAPAVAENLQKISQWTHILQPRQEEGKQKFPEPKELADQVSHVLNKPIKTKVVVCMGTTKGFIDDVRYISNYSSGGLGTAISEELYRWGFTTDVVCGPCEIKPKSFSKMIQVETNEQMLEACQKALVGNSALVMLASVLDFVPEKKLSGKLSSSEELKVEFKKTDKIISQLQPSSGLKVGFKLEAELPLEKASSIAKSYMTKYSLSYMVLNQLSLVSNNRHTAYLFDESGYEECSGKNTIAAKITTHFKKRLSNLEH